MLSVEKTLLPDVSAKVAGPVVPSTISPHWETSLGLAVPTSVVLASTDTQSKSDTEASSGGLPSDSNSNSYPPTTHSTIVTAVDSVGQSHLSSSAGSNESSPTQPKLEPKDDILKQEEPVALHSSIYQVNILKLLVEFNSADLNSIKIAKRNIKCGASLRVKNFNAQVRFA